jgi:hypothetical protein
VNKQLGGGVASGKDDQTITMLFRCWFSPAQFIEVMNMKKVIRKWSDEYISGSKRTNLYYSDWLPDWFVGSGKDTSCAFEGTWWDMICIARNILASENTKLAAPEYYRPEWKNNNYVGDDIPYDFKEQQEGEER